MTRAVSIALALFLAAGGAAAQQVGPAPVRGEVVLHAPDLVLPKHSLPAHRYALAPLSGDELSALRMRNAEQKLLHVGIGRALPTGIVGGVPLDALSWHTQADGSRVATVELHSPDAAAVRVSLDARAFPDWLTVRTYAAAAVGHRHGAVDQRMLGTAPDEAWLPEQPGDTLGIELHAAAGADLRGTALPVMRLMHLVVTPHAWDTKRLSEIGRSGSCNIHLACEGDAWFNAGRAVAKFLISTGTNTAALCTGTLLNNQQGHSDPLLVTARHCLIDGADPDSMTFYWHFERATCGGADPDSVIQTTGGAEVLALVAAQDMALLRLRSNPPSSALLSGWNANTPARNASAAGIHHPRGDLKMFAGGVIDMFTIFSGTTHATGASYLRVHWSEGTTEQGSSGSALFNTDRQVIGTLRGGAASCDRPDDPDYYGRFDLAYPSFIEWLGGTPPEPPPSDPPPPPPPPPSSGGGGGHGGVLLAVALAWVWRPRKTVWTTRSSSSAMPNGRRSRPTPN